MFRANYDVLISTRVDQRAKDMLDKLALEKQKKLGELLRDIILAAIETAPKSGQTDDIVYDRAKN